VYCKQCGKNIASDRDLCDTCQQEITKKADSLKSYLDTQTSTENDTDEPKKKKKRGLGCLLALGIFFPPIWLVLFIYYFGSSISPFISGIFKSSPPTQDLNSTPQPLYEEPQKTNPNFGFVGGDGNYYQAGNMFCDFAGNYVKWGDPFTDARGNLIKWGSPFYDYKDNYCEWGGPFYDKKGNYIVPR